MACLFFCSFNNFIRLKCVLLLWQPSRSIDQTKICFAIQFTLIICYVYWQILMPSNFEIKWTICEPFMAPNWPRFRNKWNPIFVSSFLIIVFYPHWIDTHTYVIAAFQSIDWSNFVEMCSYHNCMRIGRSDYHNHWSFTFVNKKTLQLIMDSINATTRLWLRFISKCLTSAWSNNKNNLKYSAWITIINSTAI